MVDRTEELSQFKVGGEREVALDYLNTLEIAAESELESSADILGSSEFRALNFLVRGTDRTAAAMLGDLRDELTGSKMPGEATSQETAGGFTVFQTVEPGGERTRKTAPRVERGAVGKPDHLAIYLSSYLLILQS